jgi:anti-sigma factor RsiW
MNDTHPTTAQLIDYIHGELSPGDDAVVHAHLAGCAACRQSHESETRLGELLRQHAAASERELPAGFAARIVEAATRPDRAPWWEQLRAAWRPAVALPVAAGLALAAYLSAGVLHPPIRSRTIDAAYYIENHAALASDMPFADASAVPVDLAVGTTATARR